MYILVGLLQLRLQKPKTPNPKHVKLVLAQDWPVASTFRNCASLVSDILMPRVKCWGVRINGHLINKKMEKIHNYDLPNSANSFGIEID